MEIIKDGGGGGLFFVNYRSFRLGCHFRFSTKKNGNQFFLNPHVLKT